MLYYDIHRYKCTHMFKILCNRPIPRKTRIFCVFYFGPQKSCYFLSPLSNMVGHFGGKTHLISFSLSHSLISHSLLYLPSSPSLKFAIEASLNLKNSSRIKVLGAKGSSLGRVGGHTLRLLGALSLTPLNP